MIEPNLADSFKTVDVCFGAKLEIQQILKDLKGSGRSTKDRRR